MERHVADVIALLDQLRVERCWLGGFSMGGYVALELVRRHPNRVAGLLLVDTRAEPDSAEARAGRLAMIGKIEANGTEPLVEAMAPKMLTQRTREQRPNLDADIRTVMRRTTPRGAITNLQGIMERPDQRPNLGVIRVPTLIVVGAEDPITPPDASRELQKHILGSQIRIVSGAAHLTPLEQAEPLNHFLDHWFKGTKPAGLSAITGNA